MHWYLTSFPKKYENKKGGNKKTNSVEITYFCNNGFIIVIS